MLVYILRIQNNFSLILQVNLFFLFILSVHQFNFWHYDSNFEFQRIPTTYLYMSYRTLSYIRLPLLVLQESRNQSKEYLVIKKIINNIFVLCSEYIDSLEIPLLCTFVHFFSLASQVT